MMLCYHGYRNGPMLCFTMVTGMGQCCVLPWLQEWANIVYYRGYRSGPMLCVTMVAGVGYDQGQQDQASGPVPDADRLCGGQSSQALPVWPGKP